MKKIIFTFEQEQEIIELYQKPESIEMIAKKFNVAHQTIKGILIKNKISLHSSEITKQIGINKRIKILSEKEEKELIKYYLTPHTLIETSKQFEIGITSIKKLFKKYNIEQHSKDTIKAMRHQSIVKTRQKINDIKNISEELKQKNFYSLSIL